MHARNVYKSFKTASEMKVLLMNPPMREEELFTKSSKETASIKAQATPKRNKIKRKAC